MNETVGEVLEVTWRGSGDVLHGLVRRSVRHRHAPRDLQTFSTTCTSPIVNVGSMHNVMTTHQTTHTAPRSIGPSIYDETFFQLVGDLDAPVDAFRRRALEWARLADRLRSLGASITIGSPS
jgi:hypothetical protein